jgi:integrase
MRSAVNDPWPVSKRGSSTRLTRAPMFLGRSPRPTSIRHLIDWLVTGQVVPVNPAASVRWPRHGYLDGAGLRGDPKGPLLRTIGRGTSKLTRTVLPPANVYAMICRRAAAAGIATKLGNHSFRATGITAYLKNGGTLEKAAAMANHASTRTTQLYHRRHDELSLDEVEWIVI